MERFNLIRWLNKQIEEEIDAEIWQRTAGNFNTAQVHAGRRRAFSLVKTVMESVDEDEEMD